MGRILEITPVASSVPFNNSINGLSSINVQDTLEEIDNEVNIQQIVWVKQNPGYKDFSTLESALASITDATLSKRYVIKIAPGIYTENNPIQLKSYVHIVGSGGPKLVQILAGNANQDLLTAADNIFIAGLYLNGVTGAGKCLINYPGSLANNTIFNITNCRFGSTDTAVKVTVGNFNTLFYAHDCTIGNGDQFNNGFLITKTSGTGLGDIRLISLIASNFATSYPNYIGYASGANCSLNVNNGDFELHGAVTTGSCFQVDNGGDLTITATHLEGFGKAIYTLNSGSAPSLIVSSVITQNNTIDIQADHTGTTGTFDGVATKVKVVNNAVATFFPNFQDPTNGDLTISGASIPKRRIDQITPFTTPFSGGIKTLVYSDTTTYLITGSTTGQIIKLPDATNIQIGYRVEIFNQSSQPITLQNNAGTTLIVMSQFSVTKAMLQTSGTVAGSWLLDQLILSVAGGLINYNTVSSTAFVTTSTTDVLITGFSITPEPGTYAVFYSSSASATQNNTNVNHSVYKNGTIVTNSVRTTQTVSANFIFQQTTQTVISLNGTESVDIRVSTSLGTLTVNNRSLLLLRLGA